MEAGHPEVSRKNAEAVFDTLRRQDEKILAQQQRIETLNSGMASLTTRLQALEQALNLQRAKAMGSGPTAG